MTSLPSESASAPVADLDISAYVLGRLDAHVDALSELREQLRRNTTTRAGHRRHLAMAAIALTERFAADLEKAIQTSAPRN